MEDILSQEALARHESRRRDVIAEDFHPLNFRRARGLDIEI